MKCKNCGAEYKTRELKCPYCNTENLIGKIWQIERTQAELDYEREKEKIGKVILSPYMCNRIATRAIIMVIGLYVASFLVLMLIFMLAEPVGKLYFTINKEKIEGQMEAYYNAGEYEKLDAYMDDNFVELQDYYTYTQATLLNYTYNRYLEHRLAFQALSEDEKMADDYHLEYALKESAKVYRLDCGIYSKPDKTNQELYANYQKEIMAYWVGTLGLSNEQIEELTDAEYYYSADVESMVGDVKERRCW